MSPSRSVKSTARWPQWNPADKLLVDLLDKMQLENSMVNPGPEITHQVYLEPIVGLRGWRVQRDKDRGGLNLLPAVAQNKGLYWKKREKNVATCTPLEGWSRIREKCTHGEVYPPTWTHGCGFYAWKEDEGLTRRLKSDNLRTYPVGAIGEVWAWGRMVKCENGFRAQFAYPKNLRLICVRCLTEKKAIVNPVKVIHNLEQRGQWCAGPMCAEHASFYDGHRMGEDPNDLETELLREYGIPRFDDNITVERELNRVEEEINLHLSGS